MNNPKQLIIIGTCLLLLGFVLPVMMVVGVFNTTFWLSILSYGASVSGLLLGFLGIAVASRMKEESDSPPQIWGE
ncbi:MAG: hypothetical protein ACP5GX_01670 [Anaerolineae bacterium]